MVIAAKHNPFRSERVDTLEYRLQDTGWPELLERLEKLRFRGAIVGPHGHGKTTLLDSLAPRLQARGWSTHRLQLNATRRNLSAREWKHLSTLGEKDMILLDGAEQLSLWHWRAFLQRAQRAGGLVITSHRAGLLPTLFECRTAPQLLRALVDELAPQYGLDDEVLHALYETHRGNLRDVLRALYDHALPDHEAASSASLSPR